MQTFDKYARYYDLLYRDDKDYVAEVEYICKLLQKYAPRASSILELGCGTGIHATLLAEKGYQVYGVDLSPQMLQQASSRLSQLSPEVASRLEFGQFDMRSLQLDRRFDVVISLFHALGYQTTNEDLRAAFTTAKTHLQPGGIFLFDCWYGPAVLNIRPDVRIKRLEDEEISVTRIAEPILNANENLVEVRYQIFIKDKARHTVEELQEIHLMRYLFKPEVNLLFTEFGFESLDCREWMTDREPGGDTWSVYFVAKL